MENSKLLWTFGSWIFICVIALVLDIAYVCCMLNGPSLVLFIKDLCGDC